ncbi:site-specific integrase [Acidipropionibacterium jensenii]|uniref:tyrosine-type recombinase/integrase n=1 Tax=Acidipropionibacterium jensenii TaxID=1749 RepID=UPI00110A673F|nr:site-specific integrase [Acidipropionibacterium jensenii]QCV88216.1 site-specific integrase [Acidipropionibacterium jensenii]
MGTSQAMTMASISKVTMPGTGRTRWRARYYDAEHRQHSKNFGRKVDAEQWLKQVGADQISGVWVDPRKARGTIGAEAVAWLAAHPDWSTKTRERNENIVKVHVTPRWGRVALGDVTTEALQTWITRMDLAPATVHKIGTVMSGILGYAVKMRHLGVNPAVGVAYPRNDPKRRRYLTFSEVEDLATEAGPKWSTVVYILAYCGLRWGELAALKVEDVDLGRRRLIIDESVTNVEKGMAWGTPKGRKTRTVAYPSFLDSDLAARVKDREPADLLFPGDKGGVLRNASARGQWFDGAVQDAGLAPLTPHELRHTAASLAVASGADVKIVQNMLGHKSAAMTLDTYADLFDAGLDQVADSLSRARAEALKAKSRPTGALNIANGLADCASD